MGFPGRIEQKKSTSVGTWLIALSVVGLFCWAIYSVAVTIRRPMPIKPVPDKTRTVTGIAERVAGDFAADLGQIKDGKALEPVQRKESGKSGIQSYGQRFVP